MSDHQDWDNVVFNKKGSRRSGQSKTAHINAQRRQGNVRAVAKMGSRNTANLNIQDRVGGAANMVRLVDSEETKHKRVGNDLRKAIQQARQAKSMSQKQLAQQLNVKQTIIQQYEAGKAIPNPQLITRMERALGVKLPRGKKGNSKQRTVSASRGGATKQGGTTVTRRRKAKATGKPFSLKIGR